jgi:type III pantothenate kinase
MLLAIDVGNTHSVFGLWDGRWLAVWRRQTNAESTEDELAVWMKGLFDLSGIPFAVDSTLCASVVPPANEALALLCERHLGVPLRHLDAGDVGIEVLYEPKAAVGADRIANALGALERFDPPIVVVDFGTATTFDAIDREGRYVGGAILPGVAVASQALAARTAKLPQVEFAAPARAIGRNTVESLQSGIVLGYAGAIDSLAGKFQEELGGAIVLATGGLGKLFVGICEAIERYEPTLTLDGLVVADRRMSRAPSP